MPGSAIARAEVAVLSKGEEQEAVDKGSSALHAPVATEIGHDDDDADLILPLNARPPVAPDPTAPQGHGPHPHTLTRPMTRPQAPVRPPLVSIPLLNPLRSLRTVPPSPSARPTNRKEDVDAGPSAARAASLLSLGSRPARCKGCMRRAGSPCSAAGSHAGIDRKEGRPRRQANSRESPRKTPRPQ